MIIQRKGKTDDENAFVLGIDIGGIVSMVKSWKKIIILCISFLLLVGCSRQEESAERKNTTEQESTIEQENIIEQENATEQENIKSKEGLTDENSEQKETSITVAMRNPDTMHPIYNVEKSVEQTLHLIFNTLVTIEGDGSVSPNIAKNWVVNSAENSVLIYLNQGIKWHDGTGLTAKDIIFTIQTIQQAPESPYKKNVENIANVQQVDAYTLKITYRQPFSSVLQTLAFPVIPEHIYKVPYEQALKLTPVGSGPYTFESEEPLKHIVLKANTQYFKTTPQIPQIDIMITPDEISTLNAFEQNLIDVIYTDVMDWGKYAKDKSANIYEVPTNCYEFLGVNFNKAQFQNANIRMALVYGLDRSQIVDIYYLGHALVTDTPISPASYLFDRSLEIKKYDPEKAKLLIAQEGYQLDSKTKLFMKNGIPLQFEILVNSENKERVKVAQGIKKMYEQIGVGITLSIVDKETYLSKVYGKQYDAFLGGWKLSYMMDLSFAFHSTQSVSGDNFVSYQDPQLDELLKQAFVAKPDYILEPYVKLQRYFAEKNPYISLYFRNGALITKKQIEGNIKPMPLNIYANIEEWILK